MSFVVVQVSKQGLLWEPAALGATRDPLHVEVHLGGYWRPELSQRVDAGQLRSRTEARAAAKRIAIDVASKAEAARRGVSVSELEMTARESESLPDAWWITFKEEK